MDNPEQQGNSQVGKGMIFVAALLALGVLTMLFDQAIKKDQGSIETHTGIDFIEVTLKANRQGHYIAKGEINGHSVDFLIDTGATSIAIPEALAEKIGLRKGMAVDVNTANGVGKAWLTNLEVVRLGPIQMYDVKAGISAGLQGDVLLGMTFLKHLSMQQDGNRLVLRQRQ